MKRAIGVLLAACLLLGISEYLSKSEKYCLVYVCEGKAGNCDYRLESDECSASSNYGMTHGGYFMTDHGSNWKEDADGHWYYDLESIKSDSK